MLCGFAWTIDNLLAGSGQPGLLGPVEEDMAFIQAQGIRLVVTLTERPLELPAESFGMHGVHFPVPDMSFPTPRAAEPLCRQIAGSIESRQPVLLHCRAGLGRTGMFLACTLVAMGQPPDQALATIRAINANYVQTGGQQQFITNFHRFIENII